MNEVNKLWLQIASKNILSAIDHQGKTINTNMRNLLDNHYKTKQLISGPKQWP
jgi:hypothetical protein